MKKLLFIDIPILCCLKKFSYHFSKEDMKNAAKAMYVDNEADKEIYMDQIKDEDLKNATQAATADNHSDKKAFTNKIKNEDLKKRHPEYKYQ
ncbi:MAG: hypothetical protein ACLVKO_09550 [Dysgonomonas sp.]